MSAEKSGDTRRQKTDSARNDWRALISKQESKCDTGATCTGVHRQTKTPAVQDLLRCRRTHPDTSYQTSNTN
jgi:hypothetical protein